MSEPNQPYSCGEFCPMRGCSECAYKGWESDVAQADSPREPPAGSGEKCDNGTEHGAAPERCVNTAEGLTLTRLPTQPGGFSG